MPRKLLFVIFLLIIFGKGINLQAQDFPKFSIGLSAGGSGLAGVPIQYRPSKNLAIDLGVYVRTAMVDVFYVHRYWGPGVDVGLNIFLKHRKNLSEKRLMSNGMYIKGGIGIWDLKEYITSIGWVKEWRSENSNKRFIQLQFGPSVRHRVETVLNTRYPPGYQEQTEKWYSGMLYVRLTWFIIAL